MVLFSWVASMFSSKPEAPTGTDNGQTGASTRTSSTYSHTYSDNTYSARPPPPLCSTRCAFAFSLIAHL
ncbi:hypothetical protein PMAYCL1PPCAC_09517 [Pristionchus mayeri]|uniref:Uncharacterized protein n=1 Tax=Pristionchus mayeri TaxID=1317129 RepID=A0AAN4ZDQ3_9BILA|nr:hypothetical protein PMAYCL1PPCAC_09517 [Pristionchus mayeri]